MSSVVQSLSPKAEELHARRRQMAELRRQLADKELELSTAKAELNIFERRYQNVVGPMYAELDGVKAQILSLASKFYPKAENFREEAKSAREQAREFQGENQESDQEKPTREFNPPELLKKLFRRVAKKIHPDLASSTKERERRHELMAKLNQAYDRLDEEAIRSIMIEWEAEEPLSSTAELGEQLLRVMKQMAQVRKRLNEISSELEDLTITEMFQLKKNIESAEREGHDLLQEIADDIEEKIKKAKSQIKELAYDFI
jgi:hypothetical protein